MYIIVYVQLVGVLKTWFMLKRSAGQQQIMKLKDLRRFEPPVVNW